MKVLFLLPSLGDGPGGSEKVMSFMASEFSQDKYYDVSMLTALRREHYRDQLDDKVSYASLDARRALSCLPYLVKLLRGNRYDLILTSGYINLICGLARRLVRTNTRIIARETTIPSIGLSRWRFPKLVWAVYRIAYKSFDGVICQSKDMAEDLVAFASVRQQLIKIIYNPYITHGVGWSGGRDDRWFASEDQPNCIVFTGVGKFSMQKNFSFALRALARIKEFDWRLNLVGDGAERELLEKLIKGLGIQDRVRILGVSHNVQYIVRRSDYLILVSQFEGLSNSMIEALCNFTPVVATPAPGGVREILSDIDGCLVAKNQTESAYLSELKSCQKGNRLNAEVADLFESTKIVRQYKQFATDVVNGKGERAST